MVDDVLQQVGPEVLELVLRDGVPFSDEPLLQQAGGLEQDVVDLARLWNSWSHQMKKKALGPNQGGLKKSKKTWQNFSCIPFLELIPPSTHRRLRLIGQQLKARNEDHVKIYCAWFHFLQPY